MQLRFQKQKHKSRDALVQQKIVPKIKKNKVTGAKGEKETQDPIFNAVFLIYPAFVHKFYV